MKRSAAFQNIILALSALAVLGAAVWVGMVVFEPAPVPPIPPPRTRVSFDAKADIRQNRLFNALRAVITGEIEPGALGKLNPFVGPAGAGQSGSAAGSGLGVAEEIALGGSGAVSLSPGRDGSMLVLLEGKSGADRIYEVRRFGTDGLVSSLVNWTLVEGDVSGSNDALVPAAFAQDRDGKLWFVSAAGRVAYAEPAPPLARGGVPAWSAMPLVLFAGANVQARFDGNDRLWVTDGNTLYGGDGQSFEAYDLSRLLSEDKRQFVQSAQPAERAMSPSRIQVLAGGRLGVLTPAAGIVLPLASPEQPIVFDLIPTSTEFVPPGIAWGQTPDGDLLYAPKDGSVKLTRLSATGTRMYDDPYAMPRRAFLDPFSLTLSDARALYALDYTPTSTILWTLAGENWTADIVAASGTLPNDAPRRIEPDGAGNVWAILRQRGLLRVSPPKT